MCYNLWYNAPTMLPAGGLQHHGCIIPLYLVYHYTTHVQATSLPSDLETETQLLTIAQYAPASALLHFCIAAMTLSLVS